MKQVWTLLSVLLNAAETADPSEFATLKTNGVNALENLIADEKASIENDKKALQKLKVAKTLASLGKGLWRDDLKIAAYESEIAISESLILLFEEGIKLINESETTTQDAQSASHTE